MESLRLGMDDGARECAEDRLRKNLLELMEFRGMTQAELAERLGRSQPWLSKRLSGKPWTDGGSRFQLQDLDALAHIFGLSPAQLLEPGYGKWDRRSGEDRRSGYDRRRRAASPFGQREYPQRNRDREGAA
jgi:transcriptional regulator with XRE-family HTH domain